jgi:hypothetical protein
MFMVSALPVLVAGCGAMFAGSNQGCQYDMAMP